MGKQIDFLQNELVNKNEIIKTLINDKSVSNVNHQPKDESTIVPVKTKNVESNPSMELISNEMNEKFFNSASVKTSKKSRSITILGDSILKDIKPYKIRKTACTGPQVAGGWEGVGGIPGSHSTGLPPAPPPPLIGVSPLLHFFPLVYSYILRLGF